MDLINPRFTDEDIAHLYGALRSELNKVSVQDIRNVAAAAGFDVTELLQSGLNGV